MAQGFQHRHIGIDSVAQERMLAELGHASLEALMDAAVPSGIRTVERPESAIPQAAGEAEALAELRALAAQNTAATSLIGLGYYGTHTPSVIQRNVLENPSWYTAYTPYQPEISQGRLEALINFQTMVTDLTGLDIAGASMLDEATAAVEAMLLARRTAKSTSAVFIVDQDVLPQTLSLLRHRAEPLGIELAVLDLAGTDAEELPEAFGMLVQYPGASGRVWDPSAQLQRIREHAGLGIVAADLLALTLLTPPGELGADLAVGTTQRFGVPLGFGGPHAGYLAVRKGLERQLPGRLVGVSRDADGHSAYRLTLQAREQHIRREKATSNICTAQVLLAVMAGMYAVYHGPEGLAQIARRVAERAQLIADRLPELGAVLVHEHFFDTLRVRGVDADAVLARAREAGLTLLRVDAGTVQLSVDETTDVGVVHRVLCAFGGPAEAGYGSWEGGVPPRVPEALLRSSEYLAHPVFNSHHSETAMMRYLKRLADLDYALDRGMIPLGSCTMKLNAATEMQAISWPEFAGIHPFAPEADTAGYRSLIAQLESWLAEMTGYDTVSLQPNAGSQGELAGLLAIRGYHRANGQRQRTVCLIPSNAHGTNAASAVLAGMRVVVVACDADGNVDLADLHARIAEHADTLAALMITYPSTHGVYEPQVRALCDAVHEAGGQVYVDGANLNALLGYARFGEFGGDVSHLNLHKTFAIPHGGGGPGVGPVAAKAHLAPYLPVSARAAAAASAGDAAQAEEAASADAAMPASARREPAVFASLERIGADANPVSAAPFGSAGVLPISWAYVRMMGAEGLKQATATAMLSANYLASRLAEYFPVLYTGEHGLVAHECILDLRPLREATGITVDDVAKRLVDYGFHAPTMSFPVPGTLMVEPTESEDLAELERFVEAMVAIKAEADAVAQGVWPADDNPLVQAPHTARSLVGEWTHPYPREQAVYPVPSLIRHKYWPPVRRIDQAWGDRNLVCACPPPEAFA